MERVPLETPKTGLVLGTDDQTSTVQRVDAVGIEAVIISFSKRMPVLLRSIP